MSTESQSFLPIIARLLESAVTDGKGYEPIIDLLSLLCLTTIVSHSHRQEERTPNFSAAPAPSAPSSAAGNSLQDTLANLLKAAPASGNSGPGPGPETLMTLLPLLNNPQIKAKMTPANMAAIMGLLNHMGAGSSDNKKADTTASAPPPESPAPPAATSSNQNTLPAEDPSEQDSPSSRYLNWKTNF